MRQYITFDKKAYDRKYQKEHKAARNVVSRTYRKRHPDKANKAVQDWRRRNREKVRAQNLRFKHGLSVKEYSALLEKQNHCCAICGKHQSDFKGALCVDHNHVTGQKRGLLCKQCNLVLGNAGELVGVLRKAVAYLEDWSPK